MRILYYLGYRGGIGADRWIFEGWKNAFESRGHHFSSFDRHDDLGARLKGERPDLLFIPNFINLKANREALLWARSQGIAVFLIVHWPMDPNDLSEIQTHDVASVYFGEREHPSMDGFVAATHKDYQIIPHAANRSVHYPCPPTQKYRYDVTYLGANLPKKRWFADEVLRPLGRRYSVRIFGPGWTAKDKALRGIQRVARWVNWDGLADSVNRARITVPAEEENALYSSSTISLNFHERERDLSQPHHIVNQRAFKIPACGGFQICDDVAALRQYFEPDEVVTAATTADDWFGKVQYFLENPDERRAIQEKGTRRALRDHTYENRVQLVESLMAKTRVRVDPKAA